MAGAFLSETRIYVTWDIIPVPSQNGIIDNYTIGYRIKNSTDDWKFTIVDAPNMRVEIGGLSYYTLYDVRVAGRTAIGLGPYSEPVYIRTDAYGR